MIIVLLLTVVVVVAVVLGLRRAASHDRGVPTDGHAIRRFFQYLVLYGLLVVTAIGLSGLLGRLADRGAFVEDESGLALSLAFTVVGLPLFTAVALWSRRNLRADPAEVKSVAWAAYVTLAALTSLSVAVDALDTSLQGLFGVGPDGAQGLAALVSGEGCGPRTGGCTCASCRRPTHECITSAAPSWDSAQRPSD